MNGRFLHQRFLDWAERQADAPALAGYAGELTYGELAARSAALAQHLQAVGIGAEDLVALCIDWPPDYLVAMLAVMQAGAAWLPLEPAQPPARRRELLARAPPALVLTSSVWREEFSGQPCLCVDELRLDGRPAASAPVSSEQLCYLLFTSGSTGDAKPVMVTHGNVAGLFDEFSARYGLGPADRWSWCHSVAFGFSVWEIWGALSHGACLVAVPPAKRNDPWALRELLAAEAVSVLSQTPSAFRQLLWAGALDSLDALALRLLVLSGEMLGDRDLTRWFELHPTNAPPLLDTYALTETAGQVCWREYCPGGESRRDLGECLPGVHLEVLDADGRAANTGELYISGPGVARGYFGDAALTASRFVTRPDGRRYYRSGDLVRREPDGRLSYLGRCDAQLKWRGHRIEPAEIEAQLRRCPGIADAAVGLRGAGESARLVAWYLPERQRLPGSDIEFWPSLGPFGFYDQFLYDLMAADRPRLDACREALRAKAPGKLVLDMGSGEQALFARMAAAAGARHVYAVERLPEAAERARRLVAEQGLAERITVLCADLAEVELPEPVDVAVQGIVGNIGSADGIVAIWQAARRLFAADCEPVPRRCMTQFAPVELPAEVLAQPAFAPAARPYVEALTAGQRRDLRLCLRGLTARQLLAEPALFEDLDFCAEPVLANGAARFRLSRAGRVDGLLLWTVLDCGGGDLVDYFAHQQAWLPVFVPLPGGSLELPAGTELRVDWQSRLREGICPDYSFQLVIAGQSLELESPWRGAPPGSSRLHDRLWETFSTLPEPTRLRAKLAEHLPEYMLPTAWMELPALPLNSNGKLDRSALPAPPGIRPDIGTVFVAPRNPQEAAIASIWAEVLGIEYVGVNDDFFALGGDSLSAVRLLSELQQRIDPALSLGTLFAAPTVAGLAATLKTVTPVIEEGAL